VTVTAPKGFRAAGVAAGLKTSGLDVAVVVNDGPGSAAAGVFTANRVKAAPVLWSQQVLRAGVVRAVVLNSGGANACTGPEGFQDTHATAEHAAAELGIGAIDVAVANAGVIQIKPADAVEDADWDLVIGINLTGTWQTVRAVLPVMARQRGGSIVITSSAAGLKGPPNMAHYAASKAGVVGMTRALATELGPQGIRVNCIAPTTVDTDMVHWQEAYDAFRPDLQQPTRADVEPVFAALNALPVPWIDPADTSAAVLWLASDEARYVTGITLPVDAGTALV
jgi:NAD(P)-dependent dehydrogenase (short-subunit alcohol dehydrogenase family)